MRTLLLFLSIFLMTLTVQSQAKVITVDNRANSGADYTSLSEAVGAAMLGDTIQIHPSATGYGNATITKTLHLVGLGHNPALSKYGERAAVGTISLSGNCANSSIRGLQVNAVTTSSPINVSDIKIINNRIQSYIICNNNTAIQDWVVEGNLFDTGYVQPYGDGWIVKNNIFDNTNYALYNADNTDSFLNNIVILSNGNFATNCSNPIVNNNVFILEGSTTEVVLNNSAIVFNNNLSHNTTGYTVDPFKDGSNNLENISPGFSFAYANIADYYNNDYNVSGAAENAGTDGTDLGVFGANFNFDIDGRPDDYPYMTSLDISNTSVPLGENINVTFTAGKKQ